MHWFPLLLLTSNFSGKGTETEHYTPNEKQNRYLDEGIDGMVAFPDKYVFLFP